MKTQAINPEAILRRYHRLMDANRRRYDAARVLPAGSPERAAAVAKFKAFRDSVVRPLDARLWPLMEKAGLGAVAW